MKPNPLIKRMLLVRLPPSNKKKNRKISLKLQFTFFLPSHIKKQEGKRQVRKEVAQKRKSIFLFIIFLPYQTKQEKLLKYREKFTFFFPLKNFHFSFPHFPTTKKLNEKLFHKFSLFKKN
jgi:hypothetical protein